MPPRDGRDVEQPLRDRERRINTNRGRRAPRSGRFRTGTTSRTVSQAGATSAANGGSQGRVTRPASGRPDRRLIVNLGDVRRRRG